MPWFNKFEKYAQLKLVKEVPVYKNSYEKLYNKDPHVQTSEAEKKEIFMTIFTDEFEQDNYPGEIIN